jgi:hypothetical protein
MVVKVKETLLDTEGKPYRRTRECTAVHPLMLCDYCMEKLGARAAA